MIAALVFFSGVVLTCLGVWDLWHALSQLMHVDTEAGVRLSAVGLLQGVDLFLVAIVFFVFSLGLLILFNNKSDAALPVNLPEWLKISDFVQLKVILWEAILTTMVVAFLGGAVKKRIYGELDKEELIIPVAILLIALSLFFLKKGESNKH